MQSQKELQVSPVELTSQGLILENTDTESEIAWSDLVDSTDPDIKHIAEYLRMTLKFVQGSKGSFHWNSELRLLVVCSPTDLVWHFYRIKTDSNFNNRYELDREKRHGG